MTNWICTDPDAYQWQKKCDGYDGEPLYKMCQMMSVGDKYAIFSGIFAISDYIGDITEENLEELVEFFGVDADELLDNHDLIAEFIFEYNVFDFEENPYGRNPVHTASEACQILDDWMQESHRDMWIED